MKKIIGLLFSLCLMTSVFAAQGLLWNKHHLKTVSTKWFDIIYTEETSKSAQRLYENADAIYEEVAQLYGREPQDRMPVVITSDVERYNAYWSAAYYNHIVIFDTASTESLAVFSDDLLSTFRHEATHAFTYNTKGWLWKFLTSTIGDPFMGCGFTITSGWAEGAALTSESINGEGRLNSEYAKQMVRQAKIENKFPRYKDIQGEADRLPTGSYYYFNGAFNEYLQKNYGMEKYAELWYSLVNAKYPTVYGAFKKIYGFKLEKAWSDYIDNYYIPEVESNPVQANLVKDFFQTSATDYTADNLDGSLYSSLCSSSKGLYYINEKTSALYFVPAEQLNSDTIKPVRLLTLANIQTAKVSADGRFATVTYFSINSPNIKSKSAVYDIENKKLINLPDTGIRSVSIIKNNDDYYVSGLRFHTQEKQIEIYKIEITDSKVKGFTKTAEIQLPEHSNASYFNDLENGTFAFLLRSKLHYTICTADLKGTILEQYTLPFEKFEIRDLCYIPETKEITFSYTTPDQMPQLGKLSLTSKTVDCWNKNLSGGVYNPVIYNNTCYYIGTFYFQSRLLKKSAEEINYTSNKLIADNVDLNAETPELQITMPSKNYNGFKYLGKATRIPLSTATSVSYDPYHLGTGYLPWGITLIRNNPWDSNQTTFSAGYGFLTKSAGLSLSVESGTTTSLFNYKVSGALEFDGKGFKQTTESLYLGTGLYTGNHSTLSLSNTTTYHYGRSTPTTETLLSQSFGGNSSSTGGTVDPDTNYIYGANQTQLTYANLIRTGAGKYERLGFSTSAIFVYQYNASAAAVPEIYQNSADIGFGAKVIVPGLLPIRNKQGMVTNLPAKFGFNLFATPAAEKTIPMVSDLAGSQEGFPSFNLASATFETVLFQKDIQRNIDFLPLLFASDFQISFNYIAGINATSETASDNWRITKLGKYMDLLGNGSLPVVSVPYLKATIGITPSFGSLADPDLKQLICFRVGCIIQNQKVVPVYNFAMDIKF